MMKKKKWLKISLGLILAANLLLIVFGKTYVYKALYYNFADINDHEIFYNRTVEAGHPEVWTNSPSYNSKTLSDDFRGMLEKTESIAFLVVKNGMIEYEEYWNGYSQTSKSNSFSMAKSITSILVGIALKEGKIKSLDQKVGDFLPEFKKGKRKNVTIKHLLTMTSGLNWQETYISPLSHTTEAYYGNDLKGLIKRLKVEKTPGKEFRYKSGDTQILGILLEKATGMTLSEYASENLWKVIGAKENATWSLDDKAGTEKAYCCFNSNARDFARLGKLYLNGGHWGKFHIVDPEYVEASLSGIHLENDIIDFYGYSWWLLPNNRFYARGILGQYIIVMPEEDMVIVKLGNKRGKKVGPHYEEVFSMMEYCEKNF